jgi:hypothetical protein
LRFDLSGHRSQLRFVPSGYRCKLIE